MRRYYIPLALIALFISSAGFGQSKKTQPINPPAKTSPSKPQPPKVSPVEELASIVKNTLKSAMADYEATRQRFQNELVGKGFGYWRGKSQREGDFQYHVTMQNWMYSVDDWGKQMPVFAVTPEMVDAEMAKWRDKKSSDAFVVRILYRAGIDACTIPYTGVNTSGHVACQALSAWANHEWGIAMEDAQTAILRANWAPGPRDAAYAGANARRKSIWSQILTELKPWHQQIDRFRKKWCAELWKYYEFAKAKTVIQNDIHEQMEHYAQIEIDRFKSTPKPMKSGGPIPTWGWHTVSDPYGGNDVGWFEVKGNFINPVHTSAKPSEWFTVTDPDLQVFQDKPFIAAVGAGLEPDVEKLRGYKEQPEPWDISDAMVLPGIGGYFDSNRSPMPVKAQGSDSYLLYVYGRKVPNKPSDLKALQSSDKGILYEPLAYQSDIMAKGADLAERWRWAREAITAGVPGVLAANFYGMPGMLLRVKLTPNILPGRKTFRINGAEGGWDLHQGTAKAELRFVREMPVTEGEPSPRQGGDRFEPTELIYAGERVFGEIKLNTRVDASEIEIVPGNGHTWTTVDGKHTIKAAPIGDDPSVYHTPPIQIVEPGDPLLDPANPKREQGVLYFPIDAGDVMRVQLADLNEFVVAKPVATVQVCAESGSLWVNALRRAGAADGLRNDITDWNTVTNQTVESVQSTMITQVAFKLRLQYLSPLVRFIQFCYGYSDAEMAKGDVTVDNKIKLGNHAAMLLLRDHFLYLMRELREQLKLIDTDEKKLAYMDSMAAVAADPKSPLGSIEVMKSGQAYHNVLVSGLYPGGFAWIVPLTPETAPVDGFHTEEERAKFIRAGTLEGYQKYLDAITYSIDKAEKLEDKDIQGLLELTGNGFDAVSRDLIPRMMKPVKGQAGALSWTPDSQGRAQVATLNTTWEAIRAQKDWKAIDTSVAIAATSLIPFFAPAGILRVIASAIFNFIIPIADTAVNQIPEYRKAQEELYFSLGASAVLGSERFDMAMMHQTSVLPIVINLVSLGWGIKSEVMGIMASRLTKMEAVANAVKVSRAIQKEGIQALASATAEEQAGYCAVAAAVERKAAKHGADSLTEAERAIQKTWKQVNDETKEFRKVLAVPEREPLPPAAAPVEPRPNAPLTVKAKPDTPKTIATPGQDWPAPDGAAYPIEKILATDSAYVEVSKIKDSNAALKIFKDWFEEDAQHEYQEIMDALTLIKQENLAAVRVIKSVSNKDGAYIIQELVPNVITHGKENFVISKAVTKMRGWNPDFPAASKGELQDAVGDLFCDFVSKNMVWEDAKAANLAAKRIAISNPTTKTATSALKAEILDPGRICKWDKLSTTVDNSRLSLWRGRGANGINSLKGPPMSLSDYWLATLERFGWLKYDPVTRQWSDGILNFEKFRKKFTAALQKASQRPKGAWLRFRNRVVTRNRPSRNVGLPIGLRPALVHA